MAQLPNPFKPAERVEPRIKALVYGAAGVGKTYLALSTPGKLAVIDTEGGTAFYAGRAGLTPFDVLPTKSYADVQSAVEFLASGKHGYTGLVIDPVTVIYETLQQSAQLRRIEVNRRRGRGDIEDPDLEMLDWGRIKRSYKRLMTELVNLPLHVIVTAREKDDLQLKGSESVKVGVKPDAEKGTPYYFDVVIRLLASDTGRAAIVAKDRTGTHPLNEQVADPTFKRLFDKVLKQKGSAPRSVQSDDEAAARDAAAADAIERPTAKAIEELLKSLEAVGKDQAEVLAALGHAEWTESSALEVARLTERAHEAIQKAKVAGNGTATKEQAEATEPVAVEA